MASTISRSDVQSLIKFVQSQSLLNRQLSSICAVNGLRTTGVKAELQRRIIDFINKIAASNNGQQFQELRESILSERPSNMGGHSYNHNHSNYHSGSGSSSGAVPYNGYGSSYGYGGANGHRSQPTSQQSLSFKQSPFYRVVGKLDSKTCEVMSQHRNAVHIHLRAQDHQLLAQIATDTSLRVLVFCAASNTDVQDIVFPHQSELKVNGGEVKANLRGLKGKAGSTRPVDITEHLRLKPPSYNNDVEFIYALTTKAGGKAPVKLQVRRDPVRVKFYLVINVCRITPIQTLVGEIALGKKIPKASVIQEITRKAKDSDIVMSSQVVSLKCPLSYMRLALPCRSTNCNHIQCFDATSYLQLQEQGPQWICPVCNKPAPFNQLAVDEYVRDILANTAKSVEQVTIEPDGQWRVQGPEEEERVVPKAEPASFIDDDDLIISDVSFIGSRGTTTPIRSVPPLGTPTTTTGASRESSIMPRSVQKRPIAEVVDLTFSDDDEPAPPPKKQHVGSLGPWPYPSNAY